MPSRESRVDGRWEFTSKEKDTGECGRASMDCGMAPCFVEGAKSFKRYV